MSDHTKHRLAQEFLRQTEGGLEHLASKPDRDLTQDIDRLIAQLGRHAAERPRTVRRAPEAPRQAA